MYRVHVYEFGDIAAGWPSCLFLMYVSVHCIFRSVSLSFLLYLFCVEIGKTRSLWLTYKPFDLLDFVRRHMGRENDVSTDALKGHRVL